MLARLNALVAILKTEGAALAVCLLVVLLLQRVGGAYQSEYGGHPDEAAHYVTGLMIHDYLARGLPGSPLVFAQDYYDHYPKVTLGKWPPLFYFIQAAWTLLLSPSRTSVLALMALLTALVATLLFRLLRSEFGLAEAAFGALLFVSVPLVQQSAGMVMAEIPIALFGLLAAGFFGRFLERERTADSVAFGVCASITIMTKGTGFMLALVPPVAVVLARKWHLLKRATFWLPVPIVALLCGPWMWKTQDITRAWFMDQKPSGHFTRLAAMYYPQRLTMAVGYALMVFGVIGLAVRLWPGLKAGAVMGRWVAMGALLFSGLIFHCLIGAGPEPRYLVPLLGPLIMFAIAGMAWLMAALARQGLAYRHAAALIVSVAAATFVGFTFRVPVKAFSGFADTAEALLTRPDASTALLLVSSDARGEGQFISELALREKRPGHTVRRASKLLASSTWQGSNYQPKAQNEDELIQLLATEKVGFLVLDVSIPARRLMPHHKLMQITVEKNPQRFLLVAKFPIVRDTVRTANGVAVYKVLQATVPANYL